MELVLTNLLLIALGGCLGSFASMLIYRLPIENSEITIFHPRSFCPLCKNQLSIVQLIPFVGYLYSRGTCRTCNAKISYSYLIHEVLVTAFILFIFNKMTLFLDSSKKELQSRWVICMECIGHLNNIKHQEILKLCLIMMI